MVQFACPSCQQLLEHPSPGSAVKCPACGHQFDVPPSPAPRAADLGQTTRYKGPNEKYCHECGETIRARAEICPKCGVRQAPVGIAHHAADDPAVRQAASNKIAAGLCAILIGTLGVHKFILGLTGPGLIMLLVTVLSCGVGAVVMWPISIVEGIIYLTKSDEDFYQTYIVEKRGWF